MSSARGERDAPDGCGARFRGSGDEAGAGFRGTGRRLPGPQGVDAPTSSRRRYVLRAFTAWMFSSV